MKSKVSDSTESSKLKLFIICHFRFFVDIREERKSRTKKKCLFFIRPSGSGPSFHFRCFQMFLFVPSFPPWFPAFLSRKNYTEIRKKPINKTKLESSNSSDDDRMREEKEAMDLIANAAKTKCFPPRKVLPCISVFWQAPPKTIYRIRMLTKFYLYFLVSFFHTRPCSSKSKQVLVEMFPFIFCKVWHGHSSMTHARRKDKKQKR